jgi:phenylalanyl-tRNA synthetase beta chain
MHTDAAHRFERGVDPQLPRYAIERATALIQQVMGGRAGPMTEAANPQYLVAPAAVKLRRARLARVLGMQVADEEVERILRALGMVVQASSDGWQVTPPTRRFDIAIEEDLIEEIARIHGYERIPVAVPTGAFPLVAPSEARVAEDLLRRQLIARDFHEALNYAFVDAGMLAPWKLEAGAIALANPLSAELAVMRTSLLPGLAAAVQRNHARQLGRVRLFELGRVFHAGSEAPRETQRVAAIAIGSARPEQWSGQREEIDFYEMKAVVEGLLGLSRATVEFRPADDSFGHPGRSARIWREGRDIGWIGHLHPGLAKALDLPGEVVAFELDVEPLVARAVPRAGEISRFPSVRRDLALVVPEATPWSDLRACLERTLAGRLQDVIVFDQYRGPGLETGTKSLAMGLILQEVSRTLTDSEADDAVSVALAALGRDCQARIRS